MAGPHDTRTNRVNIEIFLLYSRSIVIGTTKADFASTSYHKYLISIPFVLKSQVKSQVSSSIPFLPKPLMHQATVSLGVKPHKSNVAAALWGRQNGWMLGVKCHQFVAFWNATSGRIVVTWSRTTFLLCDWNNRQNHSDRQDLARDILEGNWRAVFFAPSELLALNILQERDISQHLKVLENYSDQQNRESILGDSALRYIKRPLLRCPPIFKLRCIV
ncbi:hypothetical protein Pelo_13834 [Pelomyxa schiedti]|nr:hypothetical protein Pelo_13834 [Pelomyxa schiedti]